MLSVHIEALVYNDLCERWSLTISETGSFGKRLFCVDPDLPRRKLLEH